MAFVSYFYHSEGAWLYNAMGLDIKLATLATFFYLIDFKQLRLFCHDLKMSIEFQMFNCAII